MNTRSEPVGGSVAPVRVTDGVSTHIPVPGAMLEAVRGADVLVGTHGFNVHQAGAVNHLQMWETMLALGGTGLFVGALWPGDSAWIGALEYTFAARSAMRAGDQLAIFLNDNFGGAASLSFVSHSLGARVVLEAIRRLAPEFAVRRLVMMAPAVDDDCLTKEFADVTARVESISILGSRMDAVLKLAYPLGNPISGIFAEGHPFWRGALGRDGPKRLPKPNNIASGWRLPDSWEVDHSDYFPPATPYPAGFEPVRYPVPQEWPSLGSDAPVAGTPPVFEIEGKWKFWQPAWTAALTSSRFR